MEISAILYWNVNLVKKNTKLWLCIRYFHIIFVQNLFEKKIGESNQHERMPSLKDKRRTRNIRKEMKFGRIKLIERIATSIATILVCISHYNETQAKTHFRNLSIHAFKFNCTNNMYILNSLFTSNIH